MSTPDLTTADPELYPRDMVGYGGKPPYANWPHGARIAVQFVLNYEEGAENCILHGDKASENFLSEIVGAAPYDGMRHMNMESFYEYGSRSGFWRIHRLFTQRNIPLTVFGVAMALARNPAAVEAMLDANWEIASHGYRWIDYQFIDREIEQAHLQRAIELHEKTTGARPKGWYLGRMSPNTRELVMAEGSFLYDADSYSDDLPYWLGNNGTPYLIVPYSLDNNDMRFSSTSLSEGEQFFAYLRDAFDTLYEEGVDSPKMMSVGLHCRLVGRPGRFLGLVKFLDHAQKHNDVWFCTREEIANHWWQHHLPTTQSS